MAVYPSPWGGRVSKLRNTTKRFQPTETVTNPNVCALDNALMAVLPLESALARAHWPSEHAFGRPNDPHGDPNRQNHRTHDWFCDREPVAKPHAARSRRTLKGKNRQNPFADRLLQKSPEVCAVRTAPEPPPRPGGRPKRTNTGSRARPDGVGAQDGGGFAPTKLPPSHKPAPVFASSAPRTLASLPYRAQTFCGCPSSHARTLSNSMTALRSMTSSVRNATWGVSTQFLAPASA